MNRIAQLLFAAALTAAPAMAQSLNVDIDRASGTGTGAPSLAFQAAGGQIGVWNSFLTTSSGAVSMLGLNGTSSGVTCTRQTGSGSSSSVAGASADFGKLFWDYMDTTGQGSKVGVTLNGVDPGLYRVYVYASLPGSAGYWVDNFNFNNYYESLVVVKVGGVEAFSGFCGGAVTANSFVKGNNYVVGNMLVGAGAPAVDIESHTGYTNNERAALNAFQLVKYTGNILYVDASATGANTGQTWFNAFTNLQDALELARVSNGQITQIWVADGTYYPTGGQASNVRSASFQLVQGCKVLGGFAGNETQESQRDPESNPVYLSGSIGNLLSLADNSLHVVTASNVNSTAVLDGVTITGGNANIAGGNDDEGGGVRIVNASPTFRNVRFIGNKSGGDAGAAKILGTGAPTFDGCLFYNNTSVWGAAAINYTGPTGLFAPSLKVNGCKFIKNNTSSGAGVGVMVQGGGAWISNSLFSGNYAGQGGAVAAEASTASAAAYLYNCTVVDNEAGVQSGGLYAYWGGYVAASNSIVFYNTSGNAWRGTEFEQYYAQPDGASVTFTYSDVAKDGRTTVAGTGNMNTPPRFVDRLGPNGIAGDMDGDYRLAADSPVIDAGSNSSVPYDFTDCDQDGVTTAEKSPLDLNGQTRQIDDPNQPDFGVGPAPVVDMGAFEYQAPPCPADYNQDGGIDGSDVQAFFADWELGLEAADVNLDGGVDGADVEAFYAAWENGGC